MMASFFCSANSWTDGNSVEELEFHIMDLGICPEFKKKGVKPVLSNQAELIANLIAGSLATQSFWFGCKHCHST